jgi:hypothetical protein
MHGTSTDDFARDPPRAGLGEIGQEGLLADEGWPTTQRFSRRAGEAFRGADYAAALEVPSASSVSDATITMVMVIGALLGAAVMILCQV